MQVIAARRGRGYRGGMPRYYFHIHDDVVARDDEGIELGGPEAARRSAIDGARALICDQAKRGRIDLGHRIEVEDETGARVLVLPFGEAVEIVGRPARGT